MKRSILLAASLLAAFVVAGCKSKDKERPLVSKDQLRSPEEWLKTESVALLRDYVRIPTRPELDGEEAGAAFLKRFFDCANIEAEVVCPAPRRCNVLARLPGRRPDGALLLLNHIDVANAFPELWKESAPFEGKFQNGYLYGRGVFDTKSLAIAQALAMRHLREHGIVPQTDVLFLAEADEELSQKWGSRWLLEHRPEWFRGVSAVLNEGGTTEVVVRDVRFWGLETLQAGSAWAELGAPSEEQLKKLAERWPRFKEPPVEPPADVVHGFALLANQLPMPLTDSLRHLDRVRAHSEELAALPDRFACFMEARTQWFAPVHPPGAEYRSLVNVFVPPGLDTAPYLTRILSDAARSGIRLVSSFQSGATSPSPYPTPFTRLLERVTTAHHPGIPFGPLPEVGGFTTSLLFRKRGFPAYGFAPIPMNRFDAAKRHGNDERVFVRDYLDGVDLLQDIIEEFAFFPPTDKTSVSQRGI
jgi:acetylornithine deacetylase/succinyl-diaminopimelate desuccinylase-like protein